MNKILKRLSLRELTNMLSNIALINDRMKEIEDLRFQASKLEFILGGHLQGKNLWKKDSIGFNGQRKRKETFTAISALYDFDCILETGTNLGATTGYLAAVTGKKIYSCEIQPERYSMAYEILIPYFNNIELFNLNSIDFLKKIMPTLSKQVPFIYLDAHWYQFLPLRDEIQIISSNCDQYLILIDDFQVQGDKGYGYDKYGSGKSLTFKFIHDLVLKFGLTGYLPSVPSQEETGARRGYVYLAKGESLVDKLSQVKLLKQIER